MLSIYCNMDSKLVRLEQCPAHGTVPLANILWVDMVTPTKDEESEIEALLGIGVPTRE